MSILTLLFYAIALLIVVATAMAVTRRNMVHAVLYLVLSFFGTAMLFYLLGATFLAALEIIIYAPMPAAQASPLAFGVYLFQTHWLAVEIASMLLLVALVGAYVLGRRVRGPSADAREEAP